MSLLWGRSEARAITSVPWFDAGNSSPMVTGVDAALRLIPLYAATSGIADDVAVTPFHAYRGGRRMDVQPQIVKSPGTNGLSAIAWKSQAVMSMLLRGFALGLVAATDRQGWPTKVAWQHPDNVRIDESTAFPELWVHGRRVSWESAVYIPATVLPGSIVGLSPVSLFRLQITKGLSAQQFASDFFSRGIMPPGVLRNTSKVLTPADASTAKTRFKATVADREVLVVGSDWEWTALTVPDDDAKFLETIKATATEFAAVYRVSPEDIGGTTGSSLTYNTLEMNELKRVRRAILPWARRLEDALTSMLPQPQYVKANLDALARADLKTRMESHEIGLRAGVRTNDEVRALEDEPPLTDEQKAEWQAMYGKGGPAAGPVDEG